MKHIYHIRDGKGEVTESTLPEVAQLIHQGRLKFTGKKERWSKRDAELCIFYYYIRVNRPPLPNEACTKPCCT